MCNLNLRNFTLKRTEIQPLDSKVEKCICEGLDVYQSLAPVSKLTGKRENPLRLLRALAVDPSKERLINAVLQQLPTVKNDPRMTDEMRINYLVDAHSTGTPAEDDKVRDVLMSMSDVLFNGAAPNKPASDEKIDFKPADVPPSE